MATVNIKTTFKHYASRALLQAATFLNKEWAYNEGLKEIQVRRTDDTWDYISQTKVKDTSNNDILDCSTGFAVFAKEISQTKQEVTLVGGPGESISITANYVEVDTTNESGGNTKTLSFQDSDKFGMYMIRNVGPNGLVLNLGLYSATMTTGQSIIVITPTYSGSYDYILPDNNAGSVS